MLRRLRRTSKIETPPSNSKQLPRTGTASFLSLPAELRNSIYNSIVEHSTLTLVPKKTNFFRRAPPPAMLLVSRQVRTEYQSILLSQARVYANVHNYDFRDITSMASSLYSSQLKLLRQNDRLVIRLHCLRCRTQDLDSLRRWLVQRADSLDRLPWSYEVGWAGTTTALAAKPDLLVGHLEMLLEMRSRMRLDENSGWELLPLCESIQKELRSVQWELAKTAQE